MQSCPSIWVWLNLTSNGNALMHVRTLQATLAGFQDCEQVCRIIEHAPGIKSISIRVNRDTNGIWLWHDPDMINAVFRTVQNTQRRLELETLCLHNWDLKAAGPMLSSVIDFSALEHLQLCDCFGLDPFFAHLQPIPMKLRSFQLDEGNQWEPTGPEEAIGEASAFLQSQRSLRSLSLRLGVDSWLRFDFSRPAFHSVAVQIECIRLSGGESDPSVLLFNRVDYLSEGLR